MENSTFMVHSWLGDVHHWKTFDSEAKSRDYGEAGLSELDLSYEVYLVLGSTDRHAPNLRTLCLRTPTDLKAGAPMPTPALPG